MDKYRLTWQGTGSLDLSQVLDDRGQPVVLPTKGAQATVNAATYMHPLVQHYLKSGLKAEKLGGPPTAAPTPPAPTPPPPPKAKEAAPPKPAAKPEPKVAAKTKPVPAEKPTATVDKKSSVVASPKEPEKDATETTTPSEKPKKSKDSGTRGDK